MCTLSRERGKLNKEQSMVWQFVSFEVDILDSDLEVQAEIECILTQWAGYLCWIASDVDLSKQKLIIDAIVLE